MKKLKYWLKDRLIRMQNDPTFSDYVDEAPFWAVRAGDNRLMRVTKMLELGFISSAEARAFLGGMNLA